MKLSSQCHSSSTVQFAFDDKNHRPQDWLSLGNARKTTLWLRAPFSSLITALTWPDTIQERQLNLVWKHCVLLALLCTQGQKGPLLMFVLFNWQKYTFELFYNTVFVLVWHCRRIIMIFIIRLKNRLRKAASGLLQCLNGSFICNGPEAAGGCLFVTGQNICQCATQ